MQYIWPLLTLFLGILGSIFIYLFGNRIIRPYLKKALKQKVSFFVSFIDDSVKAVTILLSVFVLLMTLSFSLRIDYLNLADLVLNNFSSILPKLFVIIFIFLISFIFMKTISHVTKKLSYNYAPPIALFLQAIILSAAILTTFEYMGVHVTPFLDLFRAVVYTVGLTIAISLGIAIGFSIQQKIKTIVDNKKSPKK